MYVRGAAQIYYSYPFMLLWTSRSNLVVVGPDDPHRHKLRRASGGLSLFSSHVSLQTKSIQVEEWWSEMK
jgi:hypothetical protein